MHEYALMQEVIGAIKRRMNERGQNGPVREVGMKVGMLEMHSEDGFRQAFEVLTLGGPLEGATLRLLVEPAWVECADCGQRSEIKMGQADPHDHSPYVTCPKCGTVCAVKGGHGVSSIELIMEEPTAESA